MSNSTGDYAPSSAGSPSENGVIQINVKTRIDRERRTFQVRSAPNSTIESLYAQVSQLLVDEGLFVTGTTVRLFFQGRELPRGGNQSLSGAGLSVCSKQYSLNMVLAQSTEPDAPGDQAFDKGERVEVCWGDGKYYPATVVCRDQDHEEDRYSVNWEGENSHTRGVSARYIRRPESHQGSATLEIPLLRPEETHLALEAALKDDAFRNFLQSSSFQEIFAPIQSLVHSRPDTLPQILEDIRCSDPSMLATILPFVLVELETTNPSMFEQLNTRFNPISR